ncbi:hypothetical protein ASPVEDRAFT_122721 [Aspergillus versicolor CBS 583.65]|uniref:Nucleoside phosphorylase domain-containing protein n=1 Tax=Aspergillus versicolor CBS 583.65 TaxID=1036611 RepID=A0A1L9P622_ASPVE|nr:uncharacterized protein ASPVEDRAFT_122721 [Aspergillus versicolor CBS 583.65]OJI96970.1 hypothetical protein ASPVEDRAFT_122721 [Aspergillus versicolor CBS 583.65]
MASRIFEPKDYTVGWVGALPVELAAASQMLDEEHPELPHDPNDNNIYTLGRIGSHNVVIACLPAGQFGPTSAAAVAVQMKSKFPAIRFGLMVGVGGGVPGPVEIRLGDVVVSQPSADHGGVVQYDSGTATASGLRRKGFLNAPPAILLNAVSKLRANHMRNRSRVSQYLSSFEDIPRFQREHAGVDWLFSSQYTHVEGPTCDACSKNHLIMRTPRENESVEIHYGTIASGNQVIRSGITRDQLSTELGGVLCFEMEAAGLMNGFPCIVIRGICDYADSHKNKNWQPYAAATAAAYAKDLLSVIPASDVMEAFSVPRSQASLHYEPPILSAGQTLGLNKPEKKNTISKSDIAKLSQVAYTLYSTLRGSEEAQSILGLSDDLFGLHCSLNHISRYIGGDFKPDENSRWQTSNIFKRPDVLMNRCGDLLEGIQKTLNGCQGPEEFLNDWVDLKEVHSTPGDMPKQTKATLVQAEIQWLASSMDILLDGLLRSNQPKINGESGKPVPAVYGAQVTEPSSKSGQHIQKRFGPTTVQDDLARTGNKPPIIPGKNLVSMSRFDITNGSPETKFQYQPTVPGIGMNAFALFATERNTGRTHSPQVPAYRTTDFRVPRIQYRDMDFPVLSHPTPPPIWISTVQSQLNAWESTAASSTQEKRSRRRSAVNALVSLNSHIGSIADVHQRRQFREQLEHHGLTEVLQRMKAAVGELVLLEKEVGVYFDDKADDSRAS